VDATIVCAQSEEQLVQKVIDGKGHNAENRKKENALVLRHYVSFLLIGPWFA